MVSLYSELSSRLSNAYSRLEAYRRCIQTSISPHVVGIIRDLLRARCGVEDVEKIVRKRFCGRSISLPAVLRCCWETITLNHPAVKHDLKCMKSDRNAVTDQIPCSALHNARNSLYARTTSRNVPVRSSCNTSVAWFSARFKLTSCGSQDISIIHPYNPGDQHDILPTFRRSYPFDGQRKHSLSLSQPLSPAGIS